MQVNCICAWNPPMTWRSGSILSIYLSGKTVKMVGESWDSHPSHWPIYCKVHTLVTRFLKNMFQPGARSNLLVSQVMTFPSKPEVTRRRVLVSYSIFFTQLAWPCREHTLEFKFRRSHNAMVVSSEQVANRRLSRNLGEA